MSITKAEALRRIAAAYEAWGLRTGSDAPYADNAEPMPERSQDELNAKIVEILAQVAH